MAHVLQGIPGVSVYIDDITVYLGRAHRCSHTSVPTNQRLRPESEVFKCVWAASECRVLGSVVNEQDIKPDPDKVAAVNLLPVPRHVADVRSFLGAAGYFHKHLPNFAATTSPLRALLKHGVSFQCNQECHQVFETLKQQLVSSECLRMPQLDLAFILTTDWYKISWELCLGKNSV